MGQMIYREINRKYIFEKDGVYFYMTWEQVQEMLKHCTEILENIDKAIGQEAKP